VVRLVRADTLDVGVEGRVKSSIGKVLLGVLGKTLAVESIFQMLKGEGVVQNNIWLFSVSFHCFRYFCQKDNSPSLMPARFSRGAAAARPAAPKTEIVWEKRILMFWWEILGISNK
jgi:hypothetical protein